VLLGGQLIQQSTEGKLMKRKPLGLARFLAAGALALASVAVLTATTAFATSSKGATNGTTHCDPSDPLCGLNPVLQGPPPPFVVFIGTCPSFLTNGDAWTLDFVSGNSVSHGTTNKNGDWGGGTGEGQAVLATSDGTVQYAGHLTEWGGGGNNKAGQTEGGFTLTFHGSGIAGNIDIHVDAHSTTNNSGTPTSNHQNGKVTCS
jgi:hypothetical protein